MFMVLRRRFVTAYAILALAVTGIGVATWMGTEQHRAAPVAPGAVVLVDNFLGAVQQGDLVTACRLFSSFPACDPSIGLFPLKTYRVLPAEETVGGFDVPATLNGEYAIFSIRAQLGRYRIDDIIADPAAAIPAQFST
jgi:hypothetical protein